ncbi:MAG TPA: twitch domain-containing radical SAM protein, partial [Chitinophagales bacterium]|nr:twitch domain-containing radical SAM protein [Chitinophagales bacterium]
PGGPKPLFCYLPFNSLTFSFSGQVLVCSYNRDIELGRYPQNSIDEIWNGANAKKLREHMSHNDLEFGCRHCKYFFDKGKFTNLRPLVFDKYYKNTDAVFPTVFEFELSNVCNFECQMCHGEVSSSIRKNRDKLPPIPSPYDDSFVLQLEKYIPHLREAKFYGGEPFLIPIYYHIWDKIKALNPTMELFVITNGSQWNTRIEKLLNELNFDVTVSIDALDKGKLEQIRKNAVYEELLKNIQRFSEACKQKGTHLSLSITIQKDNWEQLPRMIHFCNELEASIYVSYLERPIHFALADLSKDELKQIRAEMEQYSFPSRNSAEIYNRKCFEDFKHYLDEYIQQTEVKKYFDYEFNRDLLLQIEREKKGQQKKVQPASYADLSRWIDSNYASDSSFGEKLPKEILLRQLNSLLDSYHGEERSLLQALIMLGDFGEFLLNMKNHSLESLKKISRESLENYYDSRTALVG